MSVELIPRRSTVVAAVFCQLSVTFQIPGIFGIKVYRFLGRPQIVPVTLVTLHVAAMILFFSDLPNLVESRKLTGQSLDVARLRC